MLTRLKPATRTQKERQMRVAQEGFNLVSGARPAFQSLLLDQPSQNNKDKGTYAGPDKEIGATRMQAATNCLFISFYWARITKVFVLLPGPNKKKERQFVISLSRNGKHSHKINASCHCHFCGCAPIPGLRN